MKKILLLVFSVLTSSLFAQKERFIRINPGDTTLLNLSLVEKMVTPIPLNKDISSIQFRYLMGKYLYVCGLRSISRFDTSGNFINSVNVDTFITCMVCDTVKNEIYAATCKNIIEHYDYTLKKKKTYPVRYHPENIFFYKNKLWIQSCFSDEDSISSSTYKVPALTYKISRLNMVTGNEVFIPFEHKDYPLPEDKAKVASECTFSVYNNEVVFAFHTDTVIYKIKNDKISPIIRWTILPIDRQVNKVNPIYTSKGFIGDYLYINYYMCTPSGTISRYTYIEDTKTGKKYNLMENNLINDIIDGKIFFNKHTDNFYNLSKAANKIKTSDGPVIFIIKTKQ